MNTLALVTDIASLPIDFDMPLLLDACQALGLPVEVCHWDDPAVGWSRFEAVVLRSPWTYTERPLDFLEWCERVAGVTHMVNPLPVVRWGLDKHYLADLAAHGVPVVPSHFVEPGTTPSLALEEFLATYPQSTEFVVKPTVGAYSKNVRRYTCTQESEAVEQITNLLEQGHCVILQPYLESIDRDGETDVIYFDGVYSHAIRKSAMLMPDGTVNVPATEFRSARVAGKDERAVASAALNAVTSHLGLERPLLQARVDLIRDNDNKPQVLEMEIFEPSLSLPFAEGSAMRFAQSLVKLQKS